MFNEHINIIEKPATFIVDDFVMELYRAVAEDLGLIIHNTEYEDEYEVSDPNDDDFSETISGETLLSEYIQHNNNGHMSYSDKSSKRTFLELDKLFKDDAMKYNMRPQTYLQALDTIQCTLGMVNKPPHSEYDYDTWLKTQSFIQLGNMHNAVPEYKSTVKVPEILYEDDKKQKWQSVTASVNLDLPFPFNSSMEAYGATEAEARKELLKELETFLNAVTTQCNKLLNK